MLCVLCPAGGKKEEEEARTEGKEGTCVCLPALCCLPAMPMCGDLLSWRLGCLPHELLDRAPPCPNK